MCVCVCWGVGTSSAQCKLFNNSPVDYPLDASNTYLVIIIKNISRHCQISQGSKSPPFENHCCISIFTDKILRHFNTTWLNSHLMSLKSTRQSPSFLRTCLGSPHHHILPDTGVDLYSLAPVSWASIHSN